MLFRSGKEDYLKLICEIDLLTKELAKRQLDTSLQFEAPYKKASDNTKKASLYFSLGLCAILIIFALFYENFGNLYFNLFFIFLVICLGLLFWHYLITLKEQNKIKALWDNEFKIDEEITKKIKEKKYKAASSALNIIVFSENYEILMNIKDKTLRKEKYQKLFFEYVDALDYLNSNKTTYEDYLAYYSMWEANNIYQ